MNDASCDNRRLAVPLFLTGLGAGIALTLLFAPLSGEATRTLISNRVRRSKEGVATNADVADGAITHA
jgi:gas vesicle protein